MAQRVYNTFADFRRDLRGPKSWSGHIDEIAEQLGNHNDDLESPSEQTLFDKHEDSEDDDEDE